MPDSNTTNGLALNGKRLFKYGRGIGKQESIASRDSGNARDRSLMMHTFGGGSRRFLGKSVATPRVDLSRLRCVDAEQDDFRTLGFSETER
jgi:hypothetical protein